MPSHRRIAALSCLPLLMICTARSAALAQCIDYDDYLNWHTTLNLATVPRDVDVVGNTAYIVTNGTGTDRILAVDISVRGAPAIIGELDLPMGSEALAVTNDVAVVCPSAAGFGTLLIDVADPTQPEILSTILMDVACHNVAVADTLVYLSPLNQSVVEIYGIGDPTQPHHLATLPLPAALYLGFELRGTHLYMASPGAGIVIADVSDPYAPFVTGSLAFGTYSAIDLDVEGDYAYVGVRYNQSQASVRIYRINIANPSTPYTHSYYTTPYHGSNYPRIEVEAGICYYYISVLGAPIEVLRIGGWQDLGTLQGPGGTPAGIEVRDHDLYVMRYTDGTAGTVQAVSVSTPSPLQPISEFPLADARSVVISPARNGLAYVADGANGLTIVNISDPLNPVLEGSLDTPGYAMEIALVGDIAYLADADAGVHSIDVSVPSSPFIRDTLDTPGSAVDLEAGAGHVFVADSAAGVHVIDIANPDTLTTAAVQDSLTFAYDIDLDGIYAYVADGVGGLRVLNVEDPDNPWLISTTKRAPGDDVRRVDAERGRAYITGTGSEVSIIDVSDPASPVLLGGVDTFDANSDVDVQGIFAYVGSGTNMRLVDISDDATPRVIGSVVVPAVSRGVYIDANYAYVAAGTGGLQICPTQCGYDELVYSGFAPDVQAGFYPIDVNFTNLSQGYGLSYAWDFGDGAGQSTEEHPSYSYAAPGDYPVRLIATNGTNADTTVVVISALDERPNITGVTDVPDDQGGWLYVEFYFSSYDDTGLDRTEFYSVQRYDVDRWVNVATVGAYGEHYYTALVPTGGDGPAWQTDYRVLAHMTEGNWASAPQAGYSLDNIAPEAPSGVVMADDGQLSWNPVAANDLAYYRIFGSPTQAFEDAVEIATTTGTTADLSGAGDPWLFVTAVDDAGLESAPSSPTVATDIPDLIRDVELSGAIPNPFNPATTIRYALPRSMRVRLGIYDVGGRLVAMLVDGTVPAGRHEAVWRGRDASGRTAASGAYFGRLEADGVVRIRRLTLVK